MYIGVLSHEVDNKFDLKNDSKFGGSPLWLCGKEPTGLHLECSICKNRLTFLFQLSTSYDEYIRVLYIFCCVRSTKCNMNRNSWVCIKGKKKIFVSLENDDKTPEKSNSNLDKLEMDQNKCTKKSLSHNSIFSSNGYKEEKGEGNVFGLSNENIKREDTIGHGITSREEKLIDWNSLFSKTAKNKRTNDSIFANSISVSLNLANQKNINDHNVSIRTINTNESGNNKYDRLIKDSHKIYSNENELSTTNKMINEKRKGIESDHCNFGSYYILLLEDDEEYGKDYLYEKAKKMHQTYEHNAHILEGEETNAKEKDDTDDKEEFENDFNGCVKFYSYLSKNYNQIIRYSYNGKFLYMHKSTKNRLKGKVTTCAHCENKLVFEVQLFSTFIYQLQKRLDEKENSFSKNFLNNFNVGNVIIFTCEKDCVIIDDMYSFEHVELEIF
ncbi:conserved Plasmodium protein, unknown function [Plasmodium ovale]|nr:conserved Plasmodium protein, unknown function [Plasmodium ovale]